MSNNWRYVVMQMPITSMICVLLWTLVIGNEFIPNVVRSVVESPKEHDSLSSYLPSYLAYYRTGGGFHRFGGSETLIFGFDKHLYISFNNGEHWKSVDGIEKGQYREINMDRFHKERAFVKSWSVGIHVTEDRGRSWRKLSLPDEVEEVGFCDVDTHPFDKKLLLVHCDVRDGSHSNSSSSVERVAYASDNAGESFRHIVAPVNKSNSTDNLRQYSTTCEFAASSKDSTLENNGVYCLYAIGNQERPSNYTDLVGKMSGRKMPFDVVNRPLGTFFYTTDLGKTTKIFDELSEFSVIQMFILLSSVLVLVSRDPDDRNSPNELWISTGTTFERASFLPKGVSPLGIAIQNYHGRVFLYAEAEGYRQCILISDSSCFNFSWDPPLQHSGHAVGLSADLEQLNNLKGTLWAKFNLETEKKVSWLQDVLCAIKEYILDGESNPGWITEYGTRHQSFSVTKGSFDDGKTWVVPRVVDHSGKNKRLFKCDINDVEHCSFQEATGNNECPTTEGEPTAGIIMKSGTAGENYSEFRKDMTFISRDGGASWELAFEFNAMATFLDFGNIIVVLPKEENEMYTKFLFSLDQGRSWDIYHLDESFEARNIVILNSSGLKAIIGFGKTNEKSIDYVFYSADFSNAFEGAPCAPTDWEKWHLSGGGCIDGRSYSFNRRKPDAKCLMRKTFDDLKEQNETCEFSKF